MFCSKGLPNPLQREDGTLVRNPEEWEQHKARLRAIAQEHMYGTWPHPAQIQGALVSRESAFDGKGICERHRLEVTYDEITFPLDVTLFLPEGERRATVIANGFANDPKFQNPYLPTLVQRGYAMASFLMGDIVPDPDLAKNLHISLDENRPYPRLPCSTIMAWAWGHSVVADYLQGTPTGPLIATGASRGGKAALCAGIFDERFAVVAPTIAGCGGTGSARFCGTTDGSRQDSVRCETIGRITTSFPDWFNARYATYGQPTEPYAIGEEMNSFPLDANVLRAMVAPRAVFSSDGEEDHWSNPFGTQLGWMAAQPVFDLLGVPERNGFHIRPGVHGFDARDWSSMLDFCDHVLFGCETEEDLYKPYFTDLDIRDYAPWMT